MRRFVALAGGHPLRLGLGAAVLVLAGLFLQVLSLTPRNDRPWKDYLARTAHVDLTQGGFAVAPVSDWSYAPGGVTGNAEGVFAADFAELRNVWLMVEPSPGSEVVAHTLLLFEFSSERIVGLTIEARLEEHESYSAFNGLWNRYELAYVWASARDLLVRRAVMLDHLVYVYPLKLSGAQKQSLLRKLLETTKDIEARPRFYNTLFSNCTNELAKRAGLSWDVAFVLTGRAAAHLFRRGVIPGSFFAEAKARADITGWLKTMADSDKATFDLMLLSELKRRREMVFVIELGGFTAATETSEAPRPPRGGTSRTVSIQTSRQSR
jgi:hypothetical protein